MANNNSGKDVPSTQPPYTGSVPRPGSYSSMPSGHPNSGFPGMYQMGPPQTEGVPQPYQMSHPMPNPATSMMPRGYMISMPSGMTPSHPSQPPHMSGTANGPYMKFAGASNGHPPQPQYGYGEIPHPSGGMPGESEHPRGVPPMSMTYPQGGPNGMMSGPSVMQMMAPGSFPRGIPMQNIEGMISTSAPDQMIPSASGVLVQLNTLAEMAAAKGEFANAIQYYERITTMDPENGSAWTSLGHCYLLTDELQKAFTSYQRALYSLSDVRDPQLWYGIGLLYDKVILDINFVVRNL